jgi:hypothetical protein
MLDVPGVGLVCWIGAVFVVSGRHCCAVEACPSSCVALRLILSFLILGELRERKERKERKEKRRRERFLWGAKK